MASATETPGDALARLNAQSNTPRPGQVYQVNVRPGQQGPDPAWAVDSSRFQNPESFTSPQGVPRSRVEFWDEWTQMHPESLSDANLNRIAGTNPGSGVRMTFDSGVPVDTIAPRVDDEWIRVFPHHAPYRGNRLVHHHVNGGRWAIPVPEGSHVGSGGPWHGFPLKE